MPKKVKFINAPFRCPYCWLTLKDERLFLQHNLECIPAHGRLVFKYIWPGAVSPHQYYAKKRPHIYRSYGVAMIRVFAMSESLQWITLSPRGHVRPYVGLHNPLNQPGRCAR